MLGFRTCPVRWKRHAGAAIPNQLKESRRVFVKPLGWVHLGLRVWVFTFDGLGLSWLGTARAEDAQETPTHGHISPSIIVYDEKWSRYPGYPGTTASRSFSSGTADFIGGFGLNSGLKDCTFSLHPKRETLKPLDGAYEGS